MCPIDMCPIDPTTGRRSQVRATATLDRSRTRWVLLTVLTALLAALWVAAGPTTAHAATAAPCVADPQTGCINGTVRTAAGEPAAGVALAISGPGGDAQAVTGSDGRWSAAVTAAGDYTVTLDVATLPSGETLRQPDKNPRTVSVVLGSTAAALFPLGEPAPSGNASPTPGATHGPGTDKPVTSGGGVTFSRVMQQLTSGIVFGLLLALASVGLSLIYGTTGLSNFAHGEQVTLGGILAYIGCQTFGLPLLLSGFIAVVIGAATGWLQDAFIWHKLRRRGLGTTQQMIVTIGFAMALQYTYQFFLGSSPLRIVT